MCQSITNAIARWLNSGFGIAGPAGLAGATPAALAALGYKGPGAPSTSLLSIFGVDAGKQAIYRVRVNLNLS
jgi:hypothetical protein